MVNYYRSSLPSREAWIEIFHALTSSALFRSLPSREAWIEITQDEPLYIEITVASLAGSVD